MVNTRIMVCGYLFLCAIVFNLGLGTFFNETIGEFTLADNDYALFPLDNYSENFARRSPGVDEDERLLGGYIASPNAFPYVVGIIIWLNDTKSWCSGSLISTEFVLTAAHCLHKCSRVSLIFGAHDRRNKYEVGRVRREVSKEDFILHELWNSRTLEADIALIHVTSKVILTAQVQYILLPFGRYETEYFENYEATVSGWGRYDRSCRKRSYFLRYFNARVLHNFECESFYPFYIRWNHICVDGNQMKIGCKGDSGGPLQVFRQDGTPLLVGVLSFSKCCAGGNPTAFTRVTKYMPWIKKFTNITNKVKKKEAPILPEGSG